MAVKEDPYSSELLILSRVSVQVLVEGFPALSHYSIFVNPHTNLILVEFFRFIMMFRCIESNLSTCSYS
jgi:hypothetical protein